MQMRPLAASASDECRAAEVTLRQVGEGERQIHQHSYRHEEDAGKEIAKRPDVRDHLIAVFRFSDQQTG